MTLNAPPSKNKGVFSSDRPTVLFFLILVMIVKKNGVTNKKKTNNRYLELIFEVLYVSISKCSYFIYFHSMICIC